ncbi:MAG: lysophospholipid acyltransferase family protein [Bryobacteraceae bacterium]
MSQLLKERVCARAHPCAGPLASLAKWITGANTRWIDCPAEPRQRIYFANHTSHLDFVALWAALPEPIRARTRPVAAREYWVRNAVRSYLATNVFQSVLISRTDTAGRNLLSPLLDELERGSSLILFPEGTRGNGDEVAEFKAGLYHLLHFKPEIEAVPVYLENLNRILPKGEFLPVPLLSRVTFGPPIRPQAGEPKSEFLDRARRALCRLKDL